MYIISSFDDSHLSDILVTPSNKKKKKLSAAYYLLQDLTITPITIAAVFLAEFFLIFLTVNDVFVQLRVTTIFTYLFNQRWSMLKPWV